MMKYAPYLFGMALMALVSCVPSQIKLAPAAAYDGPTRPASETASLYCDGSSAIEMIDGNLKYSGIARSGQEIDKNYCNWRLLPGHHFIGVRSYAALLSPDKTTKMFSPVKMIPLEARAGAVYTIQTTITGGPFNPKCAIRILELPAGTAWNDKMALNPPALQKGDTVAVAPFPCWK